MKLEPKIVTLADKLLIGKQLTMSIANNQTFKLWQSFMPRRKEIKNAVSSDLLSMRVFDDSFNFRTFEQDFVKWAAIEVSGLETIPEGLESFKLNGGLYAVFHYKGLSNDPRIFQYIYGTWLPNSNYKIDNRPHFELLGEKYKNNDPDSEEEIWIPVKPK